MNISKLGKTFVQKHLKGGDDFRPATGKDGKNSNVDAGEMKVLPDSVETAPRPKPGFANIPDERILPATVAAGTMVGGALGMLWHLNDGKDFAVSIIEERVVPVHERMLDGHGFNFTVEKHAARAGQTEGTWTVEIDGDRELKTKELGWYISRRVQTSETDKLKLIHAGLFGAGIGALVGTCVGGSLTLLRGKLLPEYNGTPRNPEVGDIYTDKPVVVGGIAGAFIGAGVGALSSHLNTTTHKFETEFVNHPKQVIGLLPTEWERSGYGEPPDARKIVELMTKGEWGSEEVKVHVPEKGPTGELKVRTETREVRVGPDMLGSVLGGAAVGAVTGVAAGVLVNVLKESL